MPASTARATTLTLSLVGGLFALASLGGCSESTSAERTAVSTLAADASPTATIESAPSAQRGARSLSPAGRDLLFGGRDRVFTASD